MVVHQDLLLPDLGQPICDKPQGHIWGAASRRIGNDLYWLVRVRPRLRISPGNVRYRQQPRQHIAGPIPFHLTLLGGAAAWPLAARAAGAMRRADPSEAEAGVPGLLHKFPQRHVLNAPDDVKSERRIRSATSSGR